MTSVLQWDLKPDKVPKVMLTMVSLPPFVRFVLVSLSLNGIWNEGKKNVKVSEWKKTQTTLHTKACNRVALYLLLLEVSENKWYHKKICSWQKIWAVMYVLKHTVKKYLRSIYHQEGSFLSVWSPYEKKKNYTSMQTKRKNWLWCIPQQGPTRSKPPQISSCSACTATQIENGITLDLVTPPLIHKGKVMPDWWPSQLEDVLLAASSHVWINERIMYKYWENRTSIERIEQTCENTYIFLPFPVSSSTTPNLSCCSCLGPGRLVAWAYHQYHCIRHPLSNYYLLHFRMIYT